MKQMIQRLTVYLKKDITMLINHFERLDSMENKILVESNGTEVDSGPQKGYHNVDKQFVKDLQ